MLKQFNNSIQYIENNLNKTVDMEDVARIACVTQDSYIRFFSYMTGMTPKEYIRRRILTKAAYEVQTTKNKLIDIAVRYGYDSEAAFSRAFTKQHGVSPTTLRRNNHSIKAFSPISFHIVAEGTTEMNIRLIQVPKFDTKGVTRQFSCSAGERFHAEHEMWADSLDFVPARISDGFDGIWYGLWDDGKYSITRNPADTDKPDLETISVPSGLYAAFSTGKGGYAGDEIPKLRNQIFHTWLPSSGFKQTEDREIEVYHLFTDRALRRKNRYYELWIPVEPA